MTIDIKVAFANTYGAHPDVLERVPGRVNIIGEHTDYNGGMVLPTAIERFVNIAIRATGKDEIAVKSTVFGNVAKRELIWERTGDWSDYAVASIAKARAEGLWTGGAEIYLDSNIPHGAGLSSSAALTVGLLRAMATHAKKDISPTQLAVWAEEIENNYIGVPCGIMDQMAVAITHPGKALALNTMTLEYDLVELPKSHIFHIFHSGIVRELNEGRYAERRAECEQAQAILDVEYLCTMDDAKLNEARMLSSTLGRRAVHAATEHRRVLQAIEAIQNNDFTRLGTLMNESHASMRDDFEITLPLLDQMCDAAVEAGALGSRMTGGGFGGCIVSCVPVEKSAVWSEKMCQAYPQISMIS